MLLQNIETTPSVYGGGDKASDPIPTGSGDSGSASSGKEPKPGNPAAVKNPVDSTQTTGTALAPKINSYGYGVRSGFWGDSILHAEPELRNQEFQEKLSQKPTPYYLSVFVCPE